MVVVGLDLSTTSTGFSVYQDGELINHGRFRSDKKNVFDRIDEIYHMVGDLFKAYDIDVVFVEDVPLSTAMNKRICELLLLLQGTIYSHCINNDCAFYQMEPSEWRRLAGVKPEKPRREFQKKAAIELVNELHGLNFSWIDDKYDKTTGDSDEAEGILIGLAGTKLLNK